MNKVEYLIDSVLREVPSEIITRAFYTPTALNILQPNVRSAISSIIINDWIFRDINLVNGIESIIDLSCARTTTVPNGLIIEIPNSLTAGREITSVLSISVGYGSGIIGGSPLVDNLSSPAIATDVRLSLVGRNTIFVEASTVSSSLTLRCMLENNTDLSNLSPRVLPLLADLTVLATKAYIYNKLTIALGVSVIHAGSELGRFSDVVNEYADSMEMYKEILRTQWGKASILQDRTTSNRLLRMIMPR